MRSSRYARGVPRISSSATLLAAGVAASACLVDIDTSVLDAEGAGDAGDAGAPSVPASSEAGAGTTGVPPGTQLTPVGGSEITVAGTVIDGRDVRGCLRIEANDVIVRRSRITCPNGLYAIRIAQGVTGTLLEDVEIVGGTSAGVVYAAYTARRADLHGFGSKGFLVGSGTVVEDSFVHDPAPGAQAGIFGPSGRGIIVRRNVIDVGADPDAAVFVNSEGGELAEVRIESNLLNGGKYIVFAGAAAGAGGAAITVASNRLGRSFQSAPRRLGEGVVWTDNVWADTGEQVP